VTTNETGDKRQKTVDSRQQIGECRLQASVYRLQATGYGEWQKGARRLVEMHVCRLPAIPNLGEKGGKKEGETGGKANPQLGHNVLGSSWVGIGTGTGGFGIGKSFALCLRLALSSPFLFVSEILFA